MTRVRVNETQCSAVGKILSRLTIKPSAYQRDYVTFQADSETKLIVYLFSIGICHQTHTLINRELNLVGFEYLERVFIDLARSQSELLDPFFVAEMSQEKLIGRLETLFVSTLDRLEERAHLLIDMGKKLKANYRGRISTLLEKADGHLSRLYPLLEEFIAYSDPFRKKSSLFVTIAESAGFISIKDPQHAIPIMDYHIQRVLLRLGCVEIVDCELKRALKEQERIESDSEIRAAAIEATRALARFSGHSEKVIHDFFWPLGRSCCKEKPLCKSGGCDKSPCTFARFVELPSHTDCLFNGTCKGSQSDDYIKLWQPIVTTHYY